MPPSHPAPARRLRAANDAAALRPLFLLDPSVTFLNHASFGACPLPVFKSYQRWQIELERHPYQFLKLRMTKLMADARDVIADYVTCPPEDCVFIPNATSGVYLAAQAVAPSLHAGDEILMTDHEFLPCKVIWQDISARTGARLISAPVTLPYTTDDAFVESFWSRVTPHTRVVYLSHVTSQTALTFPIKAVVARAREAGIVTIIDGAHAPGQIPVDILDIAPDFYSSNCHKWLCAPKGSGFIYVSKPFQPLMRPLFLSWGWRDDADFTTRIHEQGTRDPSALLAVPDAIAFLDAYNWDSVRERCHDITCQTRDAIHALTGLPRLAPDSSFAQMCAIPLPGWIDSASLQEALYSRYHIEIPVHPFNGTAHIRLSVQGYNDEHDTETLVRALEEILASGP